MENITKKNENKREKRRKQTAEVFTPNKLVNEMLDKLSDCSNNSVWKEGKTFCDPACGNGNFLVWVLLIKISKGHNPTEAIKAIHGLDIKRLTDYPSPTYRLRVGVCRAIYEVYEHKVVELVIGVKHRKEAYKAEAK